MFLSLTAAALNYQLSHSAPPRKSEQESIICSTLLTRIKKLTLWWASIGLNQWRFPNQQTLITDKTGKNRWVLERCGQKISCISMNLPKLFSRRHLSTTTMIYHFQTSSCMFILDDLQICIFIMCLLVLSHDKVLNMSQLFNPHKMVYVV